MKNIMRNEDASNAIAIAILMLILLFLLATISPEFKQTVLDILRAIFK